MILLNKHKSSKEEMKGATYIGRGSPLGNPYVIGEHGTREEVIEKYRHYLAKKLINRDPAIENAIRALTPDSQLLCFCVPAPCHGEVIDTYHSELNNGQDYEEALRTFRKTHNLDRIDYNPLEDGETHINVYSKGKTPLGRELSNFAHTPFDHPKDGHFSSVEAYWYWLSTGGTQNQLRSLYGYQCKKAGALVRDELRKNGGMPIVEDFEAKIKKAILCKIEQNEALRETLKASTLPLSHYYTWGEAPNLKVTYPEDYAWIHEYIEDVRDYLNGKAFKLCIAGSRTVTKFSTVEEAYKNADLKAIEIVSGGARGADKLGELLAKKLKLPIALFPADWDTLGDAAGFIRNEQMALYCTAGLLLWDGISTGTQHMEKQLIKYDRPFQKCRINLATETELIVDNV
jgi:hypothetical protein